MKLDIIGVDVFLERRKTRVFVGHLSRNDTQWRFMYSRKYCTSKKAIPIGIDLPFTELKHFSKKLFGAFYDRIPSRENPAYADYCHAAGISIDEKNELVLLATIGRRGPSSFVFEPVYDDIVSAEELGSFRKDMGLTIAEFSAVFGIAPNTIQAVERGNSVGRDVVKRLQIYYVFPDVALFEIKINGGVLHPDKKKKAIAFLELKKSNGKRER